MSQPHLADFIDAPPFVYLSGQLALSGGKIVAGGIAAQTEQCLKNIAGVLDTCGLDLADTIKTTVWLCSANDFAEFDRQYAAIFRNHRPARSTVISELVLAGALIEIEVVAYRRTRAG